MVVSEPWKGFRIMLSYICLILPPCPLETENIFYPFPIFTMDYPDYPEYQPQQRQRRRISPKQSPSPKINMKTLTANFGIAVVLVLMAASFGIMIMSTESYAAEPTTSETLQGKQEELGRVRARQISIDDEIALLSMEAEEVDAKIRRLRREIAIMNRDLGISTETIPLTQGGSTDYESSELSS